MYERYRGRKRKYPLVWLVLWLSLVAVAVFCWAITGFQFRPLELSDQQLTRAKQWQAVLNRFLVTSRTTDTFSTKDNEKLKQSLGKGFDITPEQTGQLRVLARDHPNARIVGIDYSRDGKGSSSPTLRFQIDYGRETYIELDKTGLEIMVIWP